MSGLEAAGIVLAIIPLCINAIQMYDSAAAPLKTLRRWKLEKETALIGLREQRVNYELTVKFLLKDVVAADEMKLMLENPRAALWKETRVQLLLEDRLGISYEVVMTCVEEVSRQMASVAKILRLDLNQHFTSTQVETLLTNHRRDSGKTAHLIDKFKLAWNRQELKDCLSNVRKQIKIIDTHCRKSRRLQPRLPAQRVTTAKIIPSDYRVADGFHRALTRLYHCDKPDVHRAYLRLDQVVRCAGRDPTTYSKTTQENRYILSFTEPCKLTQVDFVIRSSSARAIRERRFQQPVAPGVCFIDFIVDGDYKSTCFYIDVSTIEPRLYSSLSTSRYKPKADTQCSENIPLAGGQIIGDSRSQTTGSLGSNASNKSVVKGLVDASDGAAQARAAEQPQSSLQAKDYTTRSLGELLIHSPTRKYRPLISERQRRVLALTLASSLMLLHTTPWLDRSWSNADIIFFSGDDDTRGKQLGKVEIKEPHLANCFSHLDNRKAKSVHKDRTEPVLSPKRVKSLLLDIAIVLMELYLNAEMAKEVEGFREASNSSSIKVDMYGVARRWFTDEQDSITKEFRTAICFCMDWSLKTDRELSIDRVIQRMEEEVLAPLQADLERFPILT